MTVTLQKFRFAHSGAHQSFVDFDLRCSVHPPQQVEIVHANLQALGLCLSLLRLRIVNPVGEANSKQDN